MTFQIDNPQNMITHNNDGDYAYQDVAFTSPKVGSDTAFAAPGTYSFNITFDQGGQNGTDFIAAGGETFDDVVTFLNTYLQFSAQIPATVLMHQGRLRIIGPSRGSHAEVRADDSFSGYSNRFFTDMVDFDPTVGIDGMVRGHGVPLAAYQQALLTVPHFTDDVALTAGTYTAEITINGISNNILIVETLTRAFGDLAGDISLQLSNGWCEFFRDRFIIHSNAGGLGTSVAITDTNLFSSITDFAALGTAVPGEASQIEVPHITMRPSTNVALGGTLTADTDGNIGIEAGITAGDGGNIGINAGTISLDPNVTGAKGGDVTIFGGAADGGSSENEGGFVGIYAGASLSTDVGARIEIWAGSNVGTGTGGNVDIRGGIGGGDGGHVIISGGVSVAEVPGSIIMITDEVQRLQIQEDGAWEIDGTEGVAGHALVSQGPGSSPVWQSVASPIAGMIVGTPPPSGIVLNYVAAFAFTIPQNFTDSQAASQIAATASTTFDVQRNGGSFGSINFAAAASVATFTSGADEVFAPGDILTIVAPVIVDASLADIGITIVTT